MSTVCIGEEYSLCLGDHGSSVLLTIRLEDGASEASLPRRKTLGACAHNLLGGNGTLETLLPRRERWVGTLTIYLAGKVLLGPLGHRLVNIKINNQLG